MAEETDDAQKTEEPTQKRLDDARKKGQVAVSREINHWFMILAAMLVTFIFGPAMLRSIWGALRAFIEAPHSLALDLSALQALVIRLLIDLAMALLPAFGVLIVAALAAGIVQVGPMFAPESIQPKLNKISPATGLKRMFSSKALVEFAKGLAKLAIVGGVAWWLVRPEFDDIERFVDYEPPQLIAVFAKLAMKLMGGVLGVMTAIAALDLLYQKLSHRHGLRMSRQELREEFKQSEGDPVVKGRLKQIRQERARRRMMQAVPKASVVITNPTHYAVALLYDQATMGAPRLVAKGVDLVAQRIRALAEENHVPIVENPPLARALYASVDIDREVPPDHYKAVAEVIGYVMKLRRGTGRPQA
ncbi:MAG: flagellar biosynthesis protein FlhB [Rhodospirillales bacterium]|nr:flagellar biosynthesis protein FlhB [Rhodospirillales bacterium]